MLKSLCKEILKSLEDEDLPDLEEVGNNPANENKVVSQREASEENKVGVRCDTEEVMQGNNVVVRGANEENATGVENTGTETTTKVNRTTTEATQDAQPHELFIPIADEAQDALPFPEFTDLEEQILHLFEEIVSLDIYSLLKVLISSNFDLINLIFYF